MKKAIALLLAAVMLTALLAGCGSGTTEPSGSTPAGTETPQKLTLILRAGSYTDVMKALAPKFEEENNCTIEILDLDLSDMYQKIALDSQNKTGAYDVVMVDGAWFAEFLDAKILTNLSEMNYSLDPDFIKGTTLGGLDANGDVFSVPFFGNVQLFYYNRDILQEYGYEAVPDNWQEVLSLAQTINNDGKYKGFLARAQAGENIVTDMDPLVLSAGGSILDKDNAVTVNTPEFKKALEMYIELINAGQIMSKDDIVAAVKNGTAAMSLIWPGWYTPDGTEPASFALMPNKLGPDDQAYNSAWYGLWYLGIPSNTPNKELALKFIEYATSAESEIATVEQGLTPVRTSAFEDASVLAQSPLLSVVFQALENGVYRPGVPQWVDITSTLGVELDNAVQGVKTPEKALADAQAACEELMK